MRIQVTNDDGIASDGLQILAAHLSRAGHEVVVIAPDRDYSGFSAALGSIRPDEPLDVERVHLDLAPGVEAWALAGSPALTVVAGRLGAFGPPPDLIVSGINAGLNTGRAIQHSGTVGAVLTAQNFGASGLAVSVADSDPWSWEAAAEVAVEVLDLLIAAPPRSALNLNVPAVGKRSDLAGIRWGRLAPFGAVRAAAAPLRDGDAQLQFELVQTDYVPDHDTDQGLVLAGYAALTALVGVTEAWSPTFPEPAGGPATQAVPELEGIVPRIVPGAPLHPVHRVPDASAPHTLRRPALGER